VVEGYMDVIALAEAGFSGAVAPLGTALTEDQMTVLWKLLPPPDAREPGRDYHPILCFDGDNAGLRAALRGVERALPLLTPAQSFRIAFMPEGQDPDDLIKTSGRAAMDAVVQQARPMVDVIWDTTIAGRAMQTPEERGSFIAAIKQRVARIAHEGLRQLYLDEITKRIDTLLRPTRTVAPPGNYQRQGGFAPKQGSFVKNGKWKPPEPAPFMLARRQPQNPQRLRERALLAVMLNYPALFEEFGEDFAHMPFENPAYEALRQEIVTALALDSHEPLDATELYRHLSSGQSFGQSADGGGDSLSEILSESTYMHAGFARPERDIEQARRGWKSLWGKHLQEGLQADLQNASRRYAEDASDENLARLLALRSQIEGMVADMNDPGQQADAV
jgi:DNA primase